MKVFVTTGVASDRAASSITMLCPPRGAFASQLASVEAYRPEKRFAERKGCLYGAKLVFPARLRCLI